jgi:hypothetical protein
MCQWRIDWGAVLLTARRMMRPTTESSCARSVWASAQFVRDSFKMFAHHLCFEMTLGPWARLHHEASGITLLGTKRRFLSES